MSRRTDIDVTPLRDAFLRSGLTASEVCRRLEWYCGTTGTPDTIQAAARARVAARAPVAGQRTYARRIGIDRAALIADALNVAPHEVGL